MVYPSVLYKSNIYLYIKKFYTSIFSSAPTPGINYDWSQTKKAMKLNVYHVQFLRQILHWLGGSLNIIIYTPKLD